MGFEFVAAAFAAGESGGEDHAVVGERGVWDAMAGNGVGELFDDDGASDAAVGGHRDRQAGAVVEPAQNFDVGAADQAPVGEVGLPAFIGLCGGKADVGRLGSLLRGGVDQAGGAQMAADRGGRHL